MNHDSIDQAASGVSKSPCTAPIPYPQLWCIPPLVLQLEFTSVELRLFSAIREDNGAAMAGEARGLFVRVDSIQIVL